MLATSGQKLFSALEGWRGLCAVFVAVLHFPSTSILDSTQSQFAANFGLFVDFFFVLSGFVIAYAYSDGVENVQSAYRFMTLRFWRLYPVHLLFLGLMIAFQIAKGLLDGAVGGNVGEPTFHGDMVDAIFTHLLLIHALGFPTHHWNGPSWSISVEFYTYLTFAALCLLTTSARAFRLWLFCLFIAGSIVILAIFNDGLESTRTYGIFRCYYGFFVGCLVFEAYKNSSGPVRSHFAKYATFHEVLSVSLVFISLWFVSVAMATLIFPILFAYLVFTFSIEKGPLSRAMNAAPFQGLGFLSYTIYMSHAFVVLCMDAVARFNDHWLGTGILEFRNGTYYFGARSPLEGAVWLLAYIAIVVVVSYGVSRYVEWPLRNYGRKIVARRRLTAA